MDEAVPRDSPEWREEGFSGQNACEPWVLERTDRVLLALSDELFMLTGEQRWAVLPPQLTQTLCGGDAGTGARRVCAQQCRADVGDLPTLGIGLLAIKYSWEGYNTDILERLSLCDKENWVSQTYNVPYAGASRAVILLLWRQKLKVPSFRGLSISFVFLSTFNPLETQ